MPGIIGTLHSVAPISTGFPIFAPVFFDVALLAGRISALIAAYSPASMRRAPASVQVTSPHRLRLPLSLSRASTLPIRPWAAQSSGLSLRRPAWLAPTGMPPVNQPSASVSAKDSTIASMSAAEISMRRTTPPYSAGPKKRPDLTSSVQTPSAEDSASAANRRATPNQGGRPGVLKSVGNGIAVKPETRRGGLSSRLNPDSFGVVREQADNQAVAQVPALAPGGRRGVVVEPVGAEHLPVVAAAGLARLRLQQRRVEVALDALRSHLLGAAQPEDRVRVPLPLGRVAPWAQGSDRRADHRGDVLARRQGTTDPGGLEGAHDLGLDAGSRRVRRRGRHPADRRLGINVVHSLGREFRPRFRPTHATAPLPPHPPAADGALSEREKGADAAVFVRRDDGRRHVPARAGRLRRSVLDLCPHRRVVRLAGQLRLD